MTTFKEKEKIFFTIIHCLFEDRNTMFIDDEKEMVRFYDFLLSNLDSKTYEIKEEDDATISLLFNIVEILSKFHIMDVEHEFWYTNDLKKYLTSYSGLNRKEYKISISLIKGYYYEIKRRFLIIKK